MAAISWAGLLVTRNIRENNDRRKEASSEISSISWRRECVRTDKREEE